MKSSGSVLVVAAHPDDEVLGCGATLARLSATGHAVHILLLADGESSRTADPSGSTSDLLAARGSAARAAAKVLGCASVDIERLPDNRLDGVELLDVIRLIEKRIEQFKPQTVFTHHYGDLNVDHRVSHDAVLAACRPQPGHPVRELYFFEVPSSTEWRPPASATAFQPNRFVDVSETLSIKLKALEAYRSELRDFPHPRSLRAIEALARWRGASAGVDAAEAFIVGRQII